MLHQGRSKKTVLSLTLLAWIIASIIVCPVSFADEKIKPKLAVLPLIPIKGQAYTGAGIGIQNLLENVIAVHTGLEDFWFYWKVEDIFPESGQYRKYVQGKGGELDFSSLAERFQVRYWISGTIEELEDTYAVSLTLNDTLEEKNSKSPVFVVDFSDHLVGFRKEFIDWLGTCGLAMPDSQIAKALWPEKISVEGIKAVGNAYTAYTEKQIQNNSDPLDIKISDAAVMKSPESYLALNIRGYYLYKHQDFTNAIPAFEKAVAFNPYGFDALDGLIWCFRKIQNVDEALKWAETKAAAKGESPEKEKASLANYMGNVAYNNGDYAQAKTLYERSLVIVEKIFGKEHPDVALCLKILANAYKKLGDYDQAKALLERSLAIDEKYYGKEHPEVATDLNNLACVYRDYAQSKALLELLKTTREKYLGKEPPEVATSLNNPAGMHEDLGDYSKAKALYERSLAIREKIFGKNHPDVAISLNNLAGIYNDLGDYFKAKAFYEQSLAIREKIFGKDHPDEVLSLINLAEVYSKLGDYDQAKALYERLMDTNEKIFVKGIPDVAQSLNDLAEAYIKLGDYTQAKALYERLLAIREKYYEKDAPYVAQSLSNLARVYKDIGDYDQAKALLERSLAIHEKYYGKEHPSVATSLSSLATVYIELGDYDQAKALLERSITIREKIFKKENPDLATSLNNLAGVYTKLGDYDQAKALFEQSLVIMEKYYGKGHPYVAQHLNNLAAVYEDFGDYARAKALFERSLAINEKNFGKEHPDVATSLNNLASIYYELGDYNQAKKLYQRSMVINEKIFGKEHPSVATSLNNLASIYYELGDYDQAKALYQRSLAIMEKYYGKEHPDVAQRLNNLAGVYEDLGDYDQAKGLYERSLATMEKYYGKEHPDVAVSLNNLAGVYTKLGDYAQAMNLFGKVLVIAEHYQLPNQLLHVYKGISAIFTRQNQPNPAIFFGKKAVNTLQQMRMGIQDIDKELQRSFVAGKKAAYKDLADLLIDQGRIPEAQQVLAMLKEEEYFDFICRDGAGSDVKTTTADFNTREAPWADRYKEINSKLAAAGCEFDRLKEKKKKTGLSDEEKDRLQTLRQDLTVAKKAFLQFLDELTTEFNQAGAVRADKQQKQLDQLQAFQGTLRVLGGNTVLVHYLVTDEKLRIILTTPRVQLVRDSVITAKELNRKIYDYRQTLQNPGKNPLHQAKALYDIVFQPIAEDLRQADARVVMVSLDGTLRYLPIAALHDKTGYVAEKYGIVLFTEAAKTKLTLSPKPDWHLAGLGLSREIEGYDPLPAVKDELEGIIKTGVDDKTGVIPGVVYLNENFSEDSFIDILDEEYPALHIASHFVFKPGTYKDSFLLLGNGDMLSLAQISEGLFDFNSVELLALSACNTAMGGDNADGHEVEGFGATAQKQGAMSVLATLWPVADKSTGIFMQNFYQSRQDHHLSKAESLRQAQMMFIRGEGLEMAPKKQTAGDERGRPIQTGRRDKGDENPETEFTPDPKAPYSHPYYWAPFILMGHWL